MAAWYASSPPLTSSPPSSPSPSPRPAACSQCGTLCLGAFILPCAHLSCRKCLHHLQQHGSRPTCLSCARHLRLPRGQGSSVSLLAKQLGTDPTTDQLVHQHLLSQGRQACLVHDNSEATMVCEDCRDHFCDGCSQVHRKQRATKDHVLQFLPTALRNVSTASYVAPTPRTYSASSTDSSYVISNLDPQPQSQDASRGQKQWKEWLQKEVSLLQQAASEQRTVVSTVKDILSLGQQVLSMAEQQELFLQTNTDCLSRCHVTQQIDSHIYVIKRSRDDVMVTVNTEHLGRRLCDVRDAPHKASVTAVEAIRSALTDLMGGPDHQDSITSLPDPAHPGSSTMTSPQTPTTSLTHSTTVPPTHTPTVSPTNPTTYSLTFPHFHSPSVDMMTATPHTVFVATPTSADDKTKPFITSIVCTQDGKLIMTDRHNDKVKVVEMSDPHTVSASLTLHERPWSLALLSDARVAVTTCKPTIYILKVTPTLTLTVTSRIHTGRQYYGVAEGVTDHTLLVSCDKTYRDPARVDVITRSGDVVRTVVTSNTMTQLESPDYLCVDDGCVLVSDWETHAVYKVNVSTGQLVDFLTHTDMESPAQVCVDGETNVYIASWGGHCVLVMSAQGQWRRLVYSPDHTDQGCNRPYGVCVTESGRLVGAWRKPGSHSLVTGYDLK